MNQLLEDNRKELPIGIMDIIAPVIICSIVMIVWFFGFGIIHWSMLPIYFCGIFMGVDAYRWFRGAYDTFDPKGLIGIFGMNFFFLSPLLCLAYEPDMTSMGHLTNPADWSHWIGIMALLNTLGVIIYKKAQQFSFKVTAPVRKCWVISPKALPILSISIIISFLCFLMVLVRMGGFSGIVESRIYGESEAWLGVGKYRTPMRSLIILIVVTLTVLRRSEQRSNWLAILLILIASFIGQFFAGGLSGARMVVFFLMIWVMGIVHYYWRPLKAKHLLIGMIPLLVFAFFYDLYKKKGAAFLGVFKGETTIGALVAENQQNIANLLVGDMSRTDIQAWILYKYYDPSFNFKFRHGRTYLYSPEWVMPKFLIPWQKMPDSYKTQTGTAYMFWEGFYNPGDETARSLRIYGLAGEAIMNFGIVGVPVMFGVWGLIVGYYRKKWFSWDIHDSRFLIAPHLLILLILALLSDSDNVFGYFWTQGLITIFILWLISLKFPVNNSLEEQDYTVHEENIPDNIYQN